MINILKQAPTKIPVLSNRQLHFQFQDHLPGLFYNGQSIVQCEFFTLNLFQEFALEITANGWLLWMGIDGALAFPKVTGKRKNRFLRIGLQNIKPQSLGCFNFMRLEFGVDE